MSRAIGALLAASALVITGCAGPGGGSATWTPAPPQLPQEVHGVGTVLERGAGPMLCLGPIAESYPPQCDGPSILGWDWSGLDGQQTAAGVTWGAYAVWGDWDGETFTVTREPVLAVLHDPEAGPSRADPWDESLPPGTLTEADFALVRAELERVMPGVLGTAFVNGRVLLEVRFDDGNLQSAVDERYGEEAIVVIPSLVPSSSGHSQTWTPPRASLPAEVTSHGFVIDDGEVGVSWGEYRIRGEWDGDVFALDRPPIAAPLPTATYDPTAPAPTGEPDPACTSSEQLLPELRSAVLDIAGVMIDLSDGCVHVSVEYDDGTLQAAVDERFGVGAIRIASSFEPVGDG